MPTIAPMGPREWSLLFALSLLWGGSFLFAGVAVRELAPLTVALGRVSIAGAALLVVVKARGMTIATAPGDWRDYAVMAFFNNVVPFSLIFWALQHIETGLAAIFNAMTPFFAVLLAQVLTVDEKITGGKVGGVLLGILGVSVLIGFRALKGAGEDLLPSLACVGAAVSYALSSIWARRFREKPVMAPATGQLVAASAMLLPLVVWIDRPWQGAAPSLWAVASIVALALVSTALAYTIYFRILRSAGATSLTLVTLLIPASASLMGWLVLDETLPAEAFAGMALIALGIAVMDGRPAAWLRHRIAGAAA